MSGDASSRCSLSAATASAADAAFLRAEFAIRLVVARERLGIALGRVVLGAFLSAAKAVFLVLEVSSFASSTFTH